MRAPHTFVNKDLAKYYGVPTVTSTTYDKLARDESKFSGLITMAGIMAMNAKPEQTSAIYRGRWVREHMLCKALPPPPPNVDAQTPPVDPNSTSRQRHEQHSADPACSPCHKLIDPVGFLFENFDATGKWRASEGPATKPLPVVATGEVIDGGDLSGKYQNAVEFGTKLAASEIGADCQARMLFRYAAGRPETAHDECALDGIRRRFKESGGNLADLIVGIATSDAFLTRSGGN
jgi:hypothetical protein